MSATVAKIEPQTEPQRLALRKGEAARVLGLSDESFDRYVVPHVRCVRLGSLRVYPITELQAFLDAQARLPLEDT